MAGRGKRGFAAMDADKQREIASMGGRAAHAKGTAHEFTADEARKAGRRGGRTVSRDRAYMAEIGRRGGLSSQGGQGNPERDRNARGRTQASAARTTRGSASKTGRRGSMATAARRQKATTGRKSR